MCIIPHFISLSAVSPTAGLIPSTQVILYCVKPSRYLSEIKFVSEQEVEVSPVTTDATPTSSQQLLMRSYRGISKVTSKYQLVAFKVKFGYWIYVNKYRLVNATTPQYVWEAAAYMNKEMSRLVNGCCKKARKEAPSSKQLKSKNEKNWPRKD